MKSEAKLLITTRILLKKAGIGSRDGNGPIFWPGQPGRRGSRPGPAREFIRERKFIKYD